MKITLVSLMHRFVDLGCNAAYAKILAENDNAKNQPYFGKNFDVIHLLPHGSIVASGEGAKTNFKASLNFLWMNDQFMTEIAADAKLIYYPQYPEVRLSGFLKGCTIAPSKYMKARDQGGYISIRRILILGVDGANEKIYAYLALENTQIFDEMINQLSKYTQDGVLTEIGNLLPAKITDSKRQLLQMLHDISGKGWIKSKRLDRTGQLVSCASPNCGGYTLEAEFGIIPNGRSEPDYLGWEIKQHNVDRFGNMADILSKKGKPITLMTPEPTGGVYAEKGVETFIRTYGYKDQNGINDRLNFGGIYKYGKPYYLNNVRLEINGYESTAHRFDGSGSIFLVRGNENHIVAEWKFADLLKHWIRKHAKAVYVPSMSRTEPCRAYRYSDIVRLGEGTSFIKLLHAIYLGDVYYDPGIKLENASGKIRIKRRSQFRIHSGDLPSLYDHMNIVQV